MSSSAVAAMPFDATFGLGPRSAFTWPSPLDAGASPSSNILGSDFGSFPSESIGTPESVPRSLTSSPPRGSFTPEQRGIKRTQDRVRRESKLNARMQRSDSNPYLGSPALLPDVGSGMSMPLYSGTPPPMSLLSEPVTSVPSQSYLPSYSPPMQDPSAHVFPTAYPQHLQPNYTMSMDYPTSYAPSDYSTRSPSLGSDPGMMYQMPAVMTSATSQPDSGHVRVVQSRPKPRCWEHGCNGRQFSTFSNLLRHQREKSGQATKASCPNCGAEFTRTTARNGHLLHDKCKQRRANSSSASSISSGNISS